MTDNRIRPYGGPPVPYDATSPEQRAGRAAKGRRSIEFGAAWIIGGLLFGVTTHEQVQGTAAYLASWGSVLYGGYRIVSGLRLRARNRQP
ncbi:hypothetical protein [Streptomyces sp. NPDC048277]|uniref:hypothetical protein n=1 Tax=Streptomyces sp. NPDC048277 TaxID=3155027 RepID=UPI0033FDC55F